MENFGQVIRYHRKKSGMTQSELARYAGVGKTVVFDIEHNKSTVRLDTLLKVVSVLNIRIEMHSPLMKSYEEQLRENG